MKNLIRWPGLIAFVVVVALFVVIPMLFLDSWIRLAVEKFASESVGAEVNVQGVSHSFSPFGVSLEKVQVTDPNNPAQNLFQVEKASADVALGFLLQEKIIIDELAVSGLRFDQPRAKPGKLFKREKSNDEPETTAKQAAGDSTKQPVDVESILNSQPLKTVAAVDALQTAQQAHRDAIQAEYAALPEDEQLKAYKQQITALTEKDIKTTEDLAAANKELRQLKDKLKQEQKKLKQFSRTLDNARSDLSTRVSEVNTAREQDYELLKGLAAGQAAAFSNLTGLLFGEKIQAWSDKLFVAWRYVAPMLASKKEKQSARERADGRWVHFGDADSLPDFLIRNADLSLLLQEQAFSSRWQDITSDHDKLGRPTQFTVNSEKTTKWQALLVDGRFRLGEQGINAEQNWRLKGVTLEDVSLSETEQMQSHLSRALLGSNGSLRVKQNLISGKGIVDLSEMAIASQAQGEQSRKVADFVSSVSQLNIDLEISGSVDNPSLSFSSDLDSQMGKALGEEARQRLAKLKGGLAERSAPAEGAADQTLQEWQALEDLASGKSDTIEDLLEAELDSLIDKEKDKLKDQLQKKLFGG